MTCPDKVGHYRFERYVDERRWLSYFYQLHEVLRSAPSSVLEVGPGNGTVSTLLRCYGLAVTTVDVDPAIGPDVVADVRDLDSVFAPKSFDTVLCAEVLEHLPLADLGRCLDQLARVAKRTVIITLPRKTRALAISLALFGPPKLLFGRRLLCVSFPVPDFFRLAYAKLRGRAESGSGGNGDPHYWEIDAGIDLQSLLQMFRVRFRCARVYGVPLNPYHVFFVLEPLPAAI